MWQASDIGHTPTQLNSTQLTQAGNRVALPSCSLLSFFIGYVAHVTREDAQGWGGVEHTHTHPSVATRLRRERDTHTRTWRASLHSHSSSSPLHGGRDGHVQSHALSLHRWRTYIASVLMVEEGPSALVCGRPHYLGRQVSYHAPRKQLTTLRAAPLLPSRALGV